MTALDGIAILTVTVPKTSFLTKTLGQAKSGKWTVLKSYGKAFRVKAREWPVSDITELARVLDRATTDPHSCAVRGGIKPEFAKVAASTGVRRLVYDRAADGQKPAEPAAFESRARRWAALDMDAIDLPENVDPVRDVGHVIDAALEQLPVEFHDATCWWQLTGSHAIKPGGRCRLWFWLSRPTTDQELKNWLRNVKVDKSIFAAVQPTYVAAPIFPPSISDFLPVRHGLRAGGRDEVEVPSAEDLAGYRGTQHGADADADAHGFVAASVDEALARMGDPPTYPDGRGFHEPIKAAFNAAFRSAGSHVDRVALLSRIDAALLERGHTRETSYIADRRRDARRWVDWYLRQCIAAEAASAGGPERCEPPQVRPIVQPDAATEIIEKVAKAFFAGAGVVSVNRADAVRSCLGFTPPAPPVGDKVLCAGGIGTGKTRTFLKHAASFLEVPSHKPNLPRCGALVAPDHNLAADTVARFRALAPHIPLYLHLGADRPDPDHSDYQDDSVPFVNKTRMCRRAAMLPDAKAAGGGIEVLCGTKKRGLCPHHPDSPESANVGVCGRLKAVVPKNGLIVLAGPHTLTEAPPASMNRTITVKSTNLAGEVQRKTAAVDPFDFVLVDEPKPLTWLNAARTIEPQKLARALERFGEEDPHPGDDESSEIISEAMRVLEWLTHDLPAGWMRAEDVRALGWERGWSDIASRALAFMPDPARHVDAREDNAQIRATLKKLKDHTAQIFAIKRWADTIAQAVKALENLPHDAQTGLVQVEPGDEEHGHKLILRGHKPIHEKWAGLPTALLDATPSEGVLRRSFPTLKVQADVQLPTPTAVTRRQVWDSAFGYASWVPDDSTPPKRDDQFPDQAATVWGNLRWLQRFLTIRAAQFKGQGQHGVDVLAILPKKSKEALQALWKTTGGIPDGLGLEHWNAIRGLDQYRGVRGAVLVSRPLPSAAALEADAWALTGVVGTTVPDGLLPQQQAAYLMRDGSGRRAMIRRHPDPTAEEIRKMISDDEVLQGDGRARPGRRDDKHPLLIETLTNAPLPVPVDELVSLATLRAEVTLTGWMLANGVCPVPTSRGFNRFVAEADGTSENAIKIRRSREPTITQPFDEFLTAPAAGWTEFEVKLSAGDRYSAAVWIRGTSVQDAALALQRSGLVAAIIRMKAAESKQNPFDVMEQRGARLRNSADAYALYPDLWGSPSQARKLFQRAAEEWDKKALIGVKLHRKKYSYMEFDPSEEENVPLLSNPVQVTYKPAGAGQKPRTALVWPHRLETFRDELEAAIGPLVLYQVEAPPSCAKSKPLMAAPETVRFGNLGQMRIWMPVDAGREFREAYIQALTRMAESGEIQLG